MDVRSATAEDAGGIAAVHVASWQAAYRGHLPNAFLDGLSVDERAARWRAILGATDLPRTAAFVLDDGGVVVGFTHVAPTRDDDGPPEAGEVTSIYVVPGTWRRGGGRLLMAAATGSLRMAGFRTATLWVLEGNVPARRFYEAVGWAADGARKTERRAGFTLEEVRYRVGLRGQARQSNQKPVGPHSPTRGTR